MDRRISVRLLLLAGMTAGAIALVPGRVQEPNSTPIKAAVSKSAAVTVEPPNTVAAAAAKWNEPVRVFDRASTRPAFVSQPSRSRDVPSRAAFGSVWNEDRFPEFTAFREWTARFLAASGPSRDALLAEGVVLAQARRSALAALIKTDPRGAIASTVPMPIRSQLPDAIASQLEERISGEGKLALLGVLGGPGQPAAEPVYRTATIGDKSYRAYVYGRRLEQATRPDISLNGIALDGNAAISDSPLRLLDPGEIPPSEVPVRAVCPVSGNVTTFVPGTPNPETAAAVQVAGQVIVLCHIEHAAVLESRLIAAEDAAGPYPGAVAEGLTAADGQPGTSGVAGRPPVAWSTGPKKVLVIRVNFTDLASSPVYPNTTTTIDAAFATNVFNQTNGISSYYAQASYGATSLTLLSADVTPVYTMPQKASAYASGGLNDTLHTDATTAAKNGGYNLANYDRIGVVFSDLSHLSGSKITYSGLGDIQGNRFWINGYFDFATVAHEVGHNYGLQHCNLWQVTDGNPVSASGTSVEYGDPFGVMGDGNSDIRYHFDMWEKSILHWIPDASVTTISAGGTYRVYRFDHQNANIANPLALKVVRNQTQDYWIGLRQLFTTNSSLMSGAYILWGYNSVVQGNLLDMTTPGTNPQDAALAVGASFHDTACGITIQPIAKGGTTPNEYLDVQISFDPRIQWTANTYNVDQQSGAAILTLTRTGGTSGSVSVNYATANGTALAGTHYTTTSGTVNWASGDSAPKTVSIPVSTAASFLGLKTFTVTLSGISGGVILNNSVATVNIASAGTTDPGFSADFIDSTVNKVLVQPDGKLVVGGWFDLLQDSSYVEYPRGSFARLNADGSVDPSFGNGAGAQPQPVYAMALQPDGRILISGSFTSVHGVTRNGVARLNADGSLDTTFDPGVGTADPVRAIVLQPDGKIVIGGDFTTFNNVAHEYLARLNSDGSLDSGFTGPDFAGTSGWSVDALALQPDNKILAGGAFYFSGASFKAGIVRLNTNGSADSTFNPGGGAYTPGSPNIITTVRSIAVQRDGMIVLGGDFTFFNNVAHNYLARLTATGTLDSTFTPAADNSVYSVLVQPDGKILAGGAFANLDSVAANHLGRLNAGGTLDTTFNGGAGSPSNIADLEMQPDGRVVAGGDLTVVNNQLVQSALTRFFSGLPGLPGSVQFSAPSYTGTEGNTLTVTATRVGGSYGAISMNYATVAGTAVASRYTPVAGTLSWTSGDASARTISVSILNDHTTEPDQTFSMNLGIPIGGVYAGSPGTTTVTVTMPYAAWKTAHFTSAELADSTISGDMADPDHDGIPNLLEYAFGLDPKAPDTANLPSVAVQNVGGTNYLTVTFRRVPSASDLSYTPQSGGAVGTWNGAPVLVGTPVNNPDGTQTVTYRDSVSSTGVSRRFMRVQVTDAP